VEVNGQNVADMVREFHEAFHLPMSDTPRDPGRPLITQRSRMLLSEVRELDDAVFEGDGLHQVALELADCVYVLYGTALTYGIDLDAVIEAVHQANMTKSHGDTVDGKIQKGPGYRKPDIAAVLARQAGPSPEGGVWHCAEHHLTVSQSLDDRGRMALHYELEHTPECDRLPYGTRCVLDLYGNDRHGWPDAVGEYVISAWTSKSWTDLGWEYDTGVEWDEFVSVTLTAPAAEPA
jgi:predicted HAD superfamily Cof-like phosphohydrolase